MNEGYIKVQREEKADYPGGKEQKAKYAMKKKSRTKR